MSKVLYMTAFAVGAGIGSVTAWYYAKKKYERIAQEEIDSVKAVFTKKNRFQEEQLDDENSNAQVAANQAKEKPNIEEYAALIRRYGGNMKGEETVETKHPYVIPPEEFGEYDDYEKISLTYYSDLILADDNDEIVDNVEDIVGDALDHFGEYEDDSVFVRCDERRCDYEILLDQRTFSEVTANRPGQVEV